MPITVHGPDHPSALPGAAPAPGPALPAATSPPTAPAAGASGLRTLPTRTITDRRGRVITWRALSALEDFDLTEIAGQNAGNEHWMLRASMAMGVRAIDGDPVSRPTSKNELRAIVARLDDDGMLAIMEMWREDARLEEEAAKASETDRAKNSAGTPGSG